MRESLRPDISPFAHFPRYALRRSRSTQQHCFATHLRRHTCCISRNCLVHTNCQLQKARHFVRLVVLTQYQKPPSILGLSCDSMLSLATIGLKIYHQNGGTPGEQAIKFPAHSIAFSIGKGQKKSPDIIYEAPCNETCRRIGVGRQRASRRATSLFPLLATS